VPFKLKSSKEEGDLATLAARRAFQLWQKGPSFCSTCNSCNLLGGFVNAIGSVNACATHDSTYFYVCCVKTSMQLATKETVNVRL
jgi:hypothetical protein